MLFNQDLTRFAVQVAAGVGVSKIVKDVIKNNVTIVTTADKARVLIGNLVIGSVVAEVVKKHVDYRIDAITEWYNKEKEKKEEDSSLTVA